MLMNVGAVLLFACAGDRPDRSWKVVTSPHFVVRTDAPAVQFRPIVERLEDVHEALATTFFEGIPVDRVEVLLFARAADYRTVAPPHLTGFFTSRMPGWETGLLVFAAEAERPGAVAATASHELAHRFLVEVSERIPTWLHEGFAKYVGASAVEGNVLHSSL
jgi:hypothetical protein